MKISLVTTIHTNIGDDLIRVGVERLLDAAVGGARPTYERINKHAPWTLFTRRPHAQHAIARLPYGKRRVTEYVSHASRRLGASTAVSGADLVVQCGTPIVWPGCAYAEWQRPLWEDVLRRPGAAPALSVAGGSCYPWTRRDDFELSAEDERAIRVMADTAEFVSVRDPLVAQIISKFAPSPAVFPCAATHAAQGERSRGDAEALMLNVMPRGGHFTWGQALDSTKWLESVDALVSVASAQHRIVFMCHSEDEFQLASQRWPHHEIAFPQSTSEYLAVCRSVRIAIVNRMHAAVALAGLGVPSIAIGTDTRLLMVEQTGQQIAYLGDVGADELVAALENLSESRDSRRRRLIELEETSFQRHVDSIRQAKALEILGAN